MSVRALATHLPPLSVRALALAAGWSVFAEGAVGALAFGVPVVALAVGTRWALGHPVWPRLYLWGLVRFAAAFLSGLLLGGVDVGWRALSPRLPLSPDWLMYDVRLSEDSARTLLIIAMSMMPGTLSADIEGTRLRVHVLVTAGGDPRKQIEVLEQHIASAFGQVFEREG
jgi:multicomponent Na+:H+ antiporter subunit E